MLKGDVIWPESRRFKSRTKWEPIGFFSESLCNATQFDLKLGFFSSSAIQILSEGFAIFLYNGGRMRMVINDILSAEDKSVIVKGQSNTFIGQTFDLSNLKEIKDTLSARDRHFFDCLAWLIRNDRFEVRIIKPNDTNGISHSKIGVFYDGLNRVAFDGSCNFSRTALLANHESISAFYDWDGRSDLLRVDDIAKDFEWTFDGKDETVSYVDAIQVTNQITETFEKKDIVVLLEEERKLIVEQCNLELPESIVRVLQRTHASVCKKIEAIQRRANEMVSVNSPAFPYGKPRDYQQQAYENWKNNRQKGLFVMATGTGKTLTALNCLLNIYNKFGFYKAVILVPTVTLVDQWEHECKKFNFETIVKVCSKNHLWKDDLDYIKSKEEFNSSQIEPSYIIISTYAAFARERSFKELVSFTKKATKQILFIADEAHNMGASRILDRLEGVKFLRRIGLSATPERRFDERGQKELLSFFGAEDHYTFEYSMRDAIDNGYLCRYYYYPHLVRLTEDEMSEYMRISVKLAKFYNFNSDSFPHADEILVSLLLKRKRIIHKAKNKEEVFKRILRNRYIEKGHLKYTLIYVPEGCKPDDETADLFDSLEMLPLDEESDHLIDRYTQIVREISETTTVRKFVSGIKERDEMLSAFAKGDLEVLTSMKCLDEGVDVPRSELVIFCASTGNPRQFIQRRGRILRMHPEKRFAIIHDLVVVPEINEWAENYKMERSLLKSEIDRVRNFATLSENADFAYTELEEILTYYNLPLF